MKKHYQRKFHNDRNSQPKENFGAQHVFIQDNKRNSGKKDVY